MSTPRSYELSFEEIRKTIGEEAEKSMAIMKQIQMKAGEAGLRDGEKSPTS